VVTKVKQGCDGGSEGVWLDQYWPRLLAEKLQTYPISNIVLILIDLHKLSSIVTIATYFFHIFLSFSLENGNDVMEDQTNAQIFLLRKNDLYIHDISVRVSFSLMKIKQISFHQIQRKANQGYLISHQP
jgi:hypothetical protein